MTNNLDHALARWRQATARLEALEKGRFAYVFQSWVGAAEVRAYDQQIAAARVMKDQAYFDFKLAKQAAPTGRPVKLVRRGPVVALPRPAAARPLTALQRVHAHAARDAIGWRLAGLK